MRNLREIMDDNHTILTCPVKEQHKMAYFDTVKKHFAFDGEVMKMVNGSGAVPMGTTYDMCKKIVKVYLQHYGTDDLSIREERAFTDLSFYGKENVVYHDVMILTAKDDVSARRANEILNSFKTVAAEQEAILNLTKALNICFGIGLHKFRISGLGRNFLKHEEIVISGADVRNLWTIYSVSA
jgi:hypothetical protein